MTSSLVGSEMCIRDSCWLSPRKHLRRSCTGYVAALASHAARCLPPRCRCLLYTSDAADDM
eukprot:976380-Prorocentrum_lima.AAC.1